METIFLSCDPSNGRPRELGTIVFCEGRNGIFIGYDQERRVAIDFNVAEKLFRAMNANYEMKIVITKKKNVVEVVKEKLLRKAQEVLSPQLSP